MDKEQMMKEQIETLKKVRESLGMNRREFSDYMEIPLRTLEEWEAGRRKMPDYLLRLIVYYTKTEMLLRQKGLDLEEKHETG